MAGASALHRPAPWLSRARSYSLALHCPLLYWQHLKVCLFSNPTVVPLFFFWPPPAGLDARAAAIVMSAIKNVAASNRTVFVTIHQPSIQIFEAFDQLMLLQVGWRLTTQWVESAVKGCGVAHGA